MSKGPAGAPPFMPHRAAYVELMSSLYYASALFRDEGDGGFEGAKTACRAVARFVAVRHENPELAAPFLAIFKAFEDLERGVQPELFSNAPPSERSRSSLRKHLQLIASVAMDILMMLGDPAPLAASHVARATASWSQLRAQQVTAETVTNWREAHRSSDHPGRAQFDEIRNHILRLDDPRAEVDRLLASPPGVPSS